MDISKLSIKWKIIIPMLALLAISSMLSMIIFDSTIKSLADAQMKSEMTKMSETMFGVSTNYMITGSMDSQDSLLKHMNKMFDVKMIRSDKLDAEYGKKSANMYAQDDFEKSVFSKGTPQFEIVKQDGKRYMRGIFPYLAVKQYMGINCFDCHTKNVSENDVLGAVSIRLSMSDMDKALVTSRTEALAVSIASFIVIFFLITTLFNKVFYKPFASINEAFKRVSNKDFTVDIKSANEDEIGALIGSLRSTLKDLSQSFRQIKDAADVVALESDKLGSSISEAIDEANEQMDRTKDVAAGATEMAQTSVAIANTVSAASEVAGNAASESKSGNDLVDKAVEKMQYAGKSSQELAELVFQLNTEVVSIENIVHVIDEIAENTNLLALNAAIEAARAGEHGRGFAVVADEVRKLAEKTADATKEVTSKIRTVQQDSSKTEETMKKALKEIEETIEMMGTVAEKLTEIAEASESNKKQIDEVAVSAGEQSKVSEQIAIEISEIENFSNNRIKSSEDLNTTYNELNKMAGVLKDIFAKYKL